MLIIVSLSLSLSYLDFALRVDCYLLQTCVVMEARKMKLEEAAAAVVVGML